MKERWEGEKRICKRRKKGGGEKEEIEREREKKRIGKGIEDREKQITRKQM